MPRLPRPPDWKSGASIIRSIYITALKRGNSEERAPKPRPSSPGFSRGDAEGRHCPSPHLQMGVLGELKTLPYVLLRDIGGLVGNAGLCQRVDSFFPNEPLKRYLKKVFAAFLVRLISLG